MAVVANRPNVTVFSLYSFLCKLNVHKNKQCFGFWGENGPSERAVNIKNFAGRLNGPSRRTVKNSSRLNGPFERVVCNGH